MAEDGYKIAGITFGDNHVEVSFIIDSEYTDTVADMRQRLIKSELFPELIDDILDSVGQLLDESASYRRNPPKTFRRSSELGASPEEETND